MACSGHESKKKLFEPKVLEKPETLITSSNYLLAKSEAENEKTVIHLWGDTSSYLSAEYALHHKIPHSVTYRNLDDIHIVHVSVGLTHISLLSSSGRVYVCGNGCYGQLGLGEEQSVAIPKLIYGLTGITSIANGAYHSVALDKNGIVHIWGCSTVLGIELYSEGQNKYPNVIPVNSFGGEKVTHICARDSHTLVCVAHKKLYSWGDSLFGCNFAKPKLVYEFKESLGEVKCAVIGSHFAAVLINKDKIYLWGDSTYAELGLPTGSRQKSEKKWGDPMDLIITRDEINEEDLEILEIAAGGKHLMFICNERLFSFGNNGAYQCGFSDVGFVQPPRSQILYSSSNNEEIPLQLFAGLKHSACLTKKGLIYVWGDAKYNKLIYTARPSCDALQENQAFSPANERKRVPGVSIISTNYESHSPRLIYSLIEKSVSCIGLGDNLTVIVTGKTSKLTNSSNSFS